jgi:succinate dehydrogenase/fumarate reductase cytochrome b subunit
LRKELLKDEKEDYLKRFNRLLAVPTLILFIILAISGYGITNPLVVSELTGGLFADRYLSLRIHTAVVLPALILLTIHILIAIRSTLIRWGVRDGNLLNAFLILLGAFAITLLVLMQYLSP